jgi:fructokinase
MTVLSIGEILWDLFPEGAHLGGAPFNFAACCAKLGHEALFLSAVGEDEWRTPALEGIRAAAVSTEFVQRTAQAPTGRVLVKFDEKGQPDYTIERPAAYDFIKTDGPVMAALIACSPGLIYFGTLSQIYHNNKGAVETVVRAFPKATKFYDVNLRSNSFSCDLFATPIPGSELSEVQRRRDGNDSKAFWNKGDESRTLLPRVR